MRTIVHVDLDAFFAAVETLLHPEYRGKPLVVGADPTARRGVVATCSYEARQYGIRSAMPMREAVRLCPHAIFVQPNRERYAHYSRLFHQTLKTFSPLVEPLSVDEAFVDMTGCGHFYPSAAAMGAAIKECVRAATGLTASVGIGPNKFVAKLASDSGKPDGLVVVTPDEVHRFLAPLPVERLWGVGPKSAARLRRLGLKTIQDVRERGRNWLRAHFGAQTAEQLYRLACGVDDRPVQPPGAPKSISRECTFDTDLADPALLRRHFARLAADVGARLRAQGLWAGVVAVKVRYPDFATRTRQRTLAAPLQHDDGIFHAALELWHGLAPSRPVRLIGVAASDLRSEKQESLFNQDERSQRISETIDWVNQKLGTRALRRGREWLRL